MTPTAAPLVAPLLASVAAALFGLAAQKPSKPKPKPGSDAAAAIVEGELGQKLDQAVTAFDAGAGGLCGSVLVACKGKVLLERGYGLHDAAARRPIGREAQWDWASVSKQFTAAALLKLQDLKKLDLDDPLSKHFKDVPKDKAKVTLRMLLNHTSGIESGFKADWKFDATSRDSFERCVLSRPMVSEPGAKFAYSNSSWYLRRIDDEVVVAIACSYAPKSNLQQLAHDLARIAAK